MKPLTATNASALLERIESVQGGELRSIIMKDPTTFVITFSVQDKNRGFDWINIAFEISSVHDARLIEDSKFNFVDMGDGVSILFDGDDCGLAFGNYDSLVAAGDSIMYLIGKSIKYEEQAFSE